MNIELKIARMRAGLSQQELGMITRLAQSVLSNIERNYQRPTRKQALLIARALNVSADHIFSTVKGDGHGN